MVLDNCSFNRDLDSVVPAKARGDTTTKLLLAVGSSSTVVMKGGPTPWMSKPSAHYKQGTIGKKIIIAEKKIILALGVFGR